MKNHLQLLKLFLFNLNQILINKKMMLNVIYVVVIIQKEAFLDIEIIVLKSLKII